VKILVQNKRQNLPVLYLEPMSTRLSLKDIFKHRMIHKVDFYHTSATLPLAARRCTVPVSSHLSHGVLEIIGSTPIGCHGISVPPKDPP